MDGTIENISFRVGGFFGFDNFNIAVNKDGTSVLSHESVGGNSVLPNDCIYSRQETKAFIKGLEQTGVFSWKRYYMPDYMVTDGTGWSVEIDRKGKRKFIREGENLFPPHWGAFCALFGIYSENIKTAVLKLNINKTVALSYTADCTHKVALSEIISIDFDACRVQAECKKGKQLVFQSNVISENASFETLNDDIVRTLTYDWYDEPDKPVADDIPFYELSVTRYNGDTVTHKGIYDKNHVPVDWQDVMNGIRHFIPDDANLLLLDNHGFYSVKSDTDMTFYSIDVWGASREYYYFSHDDMLKTGDRVIVPFGRDNEQRYGTIKNIEFFSPDSLPYPAEKTKYIERRLEPGEKIPETTVFCPVLEDEIDSGTCLIICDVADGFVKLSALQKEVTWNEEQRQRCLSCKWHYDECGLCRTESTNDRITQSDFTEQDVIDAHKFSGSNQPELSKGEKCGCFNCLKIFDSTEITDYLTGDNDCDRDGTAFCPYCGIDSVIGESSGYPITQEFLTAMNKKWF